MKTIAIIFCISLSISTFAQRGDGRGPQGTPQERAERQVNRLKTDLALNDDQTAKLKVLFTNRMVKGDSLRAINTDGGQRRGKGNRETVQVEMQKFNDSVKAILTAEQATKYEQMQEERRQKMKDRVGGRK